MGYSISQEVHERWQLLTLCEQLYLYHQLDRHVRLELLAAQIDREVTA